MPDTTISQLPSAPALATSVVAADNAAGDLTSRVTLGSIAALGGGQPASHASSHGTSGSDPVTPAAIGAVASNDARLTDSRTPTAHAASHASSGQDAITPASIGAAAASHSHVLASVTDAGTAASRDVPASGNASSLQVVLGSDTRLTDSRVPAGHSASHRAGGSDYPAPVATAITLASSQNNWSPGVSDVIYITASSSVAITGMTASAIDGFAVLLVNVGASSSVTLSHESSASVAANRFRSAYGANYVLYPDGGSAVLVYHAAASRWRIL